MIQLYFYKYSTVKPVYNGHPWDQKNDRYEEGCMKKISGK
jgi:hypothetical protein